MTTQPAEIICDVKERSQIPLDSRMLLSITVGCTLVCKIRMRIMQKNENLGDAKIFSDWNLAWQQKTRFAC